MLVVSFCIECCLEQHRAHVPPRVYLPVQRVKGCPFLAPSLGLSLTLGLAFGILRRIQCSQWADPHVFLHDMSIEPNTTIIVRLRASLFPGHCATPFVI